MNKKRIIVPLILMLAVTVYWVLFHKDKTLKFIPDNADAIVLIDVKKITGQYIFSLVAYPSHWSGAGAKDKNLASLKDAGIRIPDFLQIFHIKDSKFSEWYTVIELRDPQKFRTFLKARKFIDKEEGRFQKDQFFLIIEQEYCILGTSDKAFESIKKQIFQSSKKNALNADQFIHSTLGSVSFISGEKIQNFSLELKNDELEIKNSSAPEIIPSIASGLQERNHFLEMELDAENIKRYARFFNKSIADSSQISYLRATADLKQVNDTIVSYGYDDNFNEIEQKTFQKITQPSYIIDLQSQNPDKTWDFFQSKKWLNTREQFTAIPFQPNNISKKRNGLVIRSTGIPISLSPGLHENYILIRNNALLFSSLKTLSDTEKKFISDIDYVLYGNKGSDYWVKVKVKKGELPLILRW